MIELNSEVKITDPCYSNDTWCSYKLDNVKSGQYNTRVEYYNEFYGVRVAELIAIHEDYDIDSEDVNWEVVKDADIGVDSGQCGIFDANYYKQQKEQDEIWGKQNKEEPFYNKCCSCTDGEAKYSEIDNKGVVSCTGFGDGSYNLYTIKINNEIVAIKVVFINTNREEDYEEDYEG